MIPVRWISKIVVAVISGLLLFFMIKPMFVWQLEVDISLKALQTAHVTVYYTREANKGGDQAQTMPWIASQFFAEKTFHFSPVEQGRELRFLLDEKTSDYFFRKISIRAKAGFITIPVGEWTGEEIQEILLPPARINAATEHQAWIKNTPKQRWVFLRKELQQQITGVGRHQPMINFWMCFIAVVLGVVISLLVHEPLRKNTVSDQPFAWRRLSGLSIGMMGMLGFLTLNSWLNWIPDKPSTENRLLAERPSLSVKNFFEYPQQFIRYTEDHFAFRNYFFFIHSWVKARLLQAASLPQRIIMGKGGWMYEVDDFAMRDYRRINRPQEKDMRRMKAILKERIEWCKERGIRYDILVPPNRNRIYPELFPSRYYVLPNHGHNRLDYYKQYLQQKLGFHLLDPSDSLLSNKRRHDVYFSTDSHWNLFGAWVTYEYLMNEWKKEFPSLEPYRYDELVIRDSFNNQGDLAAMLGLENTYKRKEFVIQLRNPHDSLLMPDHSEIVMRFTNTAPRNDSKLKLMVFRDSYSNYLIPFLNKHFRETVYVWNYDFLYELIEQEKPDIVLLEVQQRAMIYGLENGNLFKR